MSISLNTRIQWLHKQIFEQRYPNAYRISEKFGISHRQAQRDIDYLKKEMNAPLEYDPRKKGFYYTESFSLPSYTALANEENYSSAVSRLNGGFDDVGQSETLQMQIPYTAEIEIQSKLGLLELKNFIVKATSKNTYLCEFHNIDIFLGLLFTLNADVKIITPDWLSEKFIKCAERVLRNNKVEKQ